MLLKKRWDWSLITLFLQFQKIIIKGERKLTPYANIGILSPLSIQYYNPEKRWSKKPNEEFFEFSKLSVSWVTGIYDNS